MSLQIFEFENKYNYIQMTNYYRYELYDIIFNERVFRTRTITL